MAVNDQQYIKVGAGAVIMKGNKVLLAKRKGSHADGEWGSIGGHMEYGEHPTETSKREAREELGIEIGNFKFASCTNMIKYGKHYIDISFTAEILNGEPKIMEPDKISEIGWFDINDLPANLFKPVTIVLEAVKKQNYYFEVKED